MATPIFKYQLPPVGTLDELYEQYPDDGIYGAFAYVSTASKYAWWNHELTIPQWELTTITPETPPVAIQEPDKVEISDIPLLRYLKDPVSTVDELLERYPDGGEHGWFMILESENTLIWWNDKVEPAVWRTLGGEGSGGTIIGGGSGGSDLYTNPAPVPTTLGGIEKNSTFDKKTMQEMWDALLYPDSNPAVSNPTYSLTNSYGKTYAEVGEELNILFGNNFSRGLINPLYIQNPTTLEWEPTANHPRVGEGVFTGVENGIKLIVLGANTWSRTATFAQGAQPKTSKGNDYLKPYPETEPTGTLSASVTVMGVYPIYATSVNMSTFTKQPLQGHGSEIVANFAAEVGGKQTVKIPYSVTIDAQTHILWNISKLYLKDINDRWVVADMATNFGTPTDETINGVLYKVYTNIYPQMAARPAKFTV